MAETLSPCPECGGERVRGELTHNAEFSPPAHVVVVREGQTLPFVLTMHVKVCLSCGYTAYYADDPTQIVRKRAYRADLATKKEIIEMRKTSYETELAKKKEALAARKAQFEAQRAARRAESKGGKPARPNE